MKNLFAKFALSCALIAATFLGTQQANADFIAYDNHVTAKPLQNFGHNLGLDFHVNSMIRVPGLGAFNNGVMANLAGVDPTKGVTVGIFSLATGLLVGPSVHFTAASVGGTQVGGDYFFATNYQLAVGDYSIVAFNDKNFNSQGLANTTATLNTGGGLVTFTANGGTTNGRYDGANSFALPTGVAGHPALYPGVPRFDAGTFSFAAVPEPGTMALLGLGAMGFALRNIRRRRASV